MITQEIRGQIRDIVLYAMSVYPNAHLGSVSRTEDMQSAFRFLHNRIRTGETIQEALCSLEADAVRYEDM